jgi:hypothetical protein
LMVTATQCPSSCWPASAVSDNVRGALQRHFGGATTQVIPARYGTTASANNAGYSAGRYSFGGSQYRSLGGFCRGSPGCRIDHAPNSDSNHVVPQVQRFLPGVCCYCAPMGVRSSLVHAVCAATMIASCSSSDGAERAPSASSGNLDTESSVSTETVLDLVESTGQWQCRQVENDFTWSCTGIDTNVFVVDTATTAIQSRFVADNGGIPCIVSSDGRWFVTAYGDGGAAGIAAEGRAVDLLAPMIGGREACRGN